MYDGLLVPPCYSFDEPYRTEVTVMSNGTRNAVDATQWVFSSFVYKLFGGVTEVDPVT